MRIVFNDFLFMADAEAVVKVVFRLIHEKDGEDLIGSNSVRQSGDLLKKTVQVEGRRDVMIDFNERSSESLDPYPEPVS